jgi:NodT family efflux transporter outer membrane factor (OMF) lipoprotein
VIAMKYSGCWILFAGMALLGSACSVGPKYAKPAAPVPPAYKEPPPASFKEGSVWKFGEPKDAADRGKWWEVFNDPQLNALEEQIDPSNQTLAVAEAQFRAARSAIKVARAGLYPSVAAGVFVGGSQQSATRTTGFPITTPPLATLQIAFDASWEADVWGRIHNTIEANVANAQASAADLATVRLSLQAELAANYFQLRGLDAEKQLLDSNVAAYQKALDLTTNRYNQGVASRVDVVQAQTQLETTRAQATDTEVLRAQYEHAIATLIGKPPAEFSVAPAAMSSKPPSIPAGLPSDLLERRPDIASAERHMASANAGIGIAKAAFYPSITIDASAGLQSSSLLEFFTWPSRIWSIGPTLAQTLFDAGRRRGLSAQAQASYDAVVAGYRQSVLNAFQEVEDDLAALRILEQEDREQTEAVRLAARSLELAMYRYQGGITTYLEVITAQSADLLNERTAVSILTRRMVTSVLLIKALGGGWSVSALPSTQQLAGK